MKRIAGKLMLIFAIVSLLLLWGACGQIMTASAADNPALPGHLDQYNDHQNNDYDNIRRNNWVAQTFTVTTNAVLTTVKLRLGGGAAGGRTVTPNGDTGGLVLQLYHTSGSVPSSLIDTAISPKGSGSGFQTYTFTFNNRDYLLPGTTYALVLHANQNHTNYKIRDYESKQTDAYPNGKMFCSSDSGHNWYTYTGKNANMNYVDLWFEIWDISLDTYSGADHHQLWGEIQDPYDSAHRTVYVYGAGFKPHQQYEVAYYDPGGFNFCTDSRQSHDGSLSSQYNLALHLASQHDSWDGKPWHVVVYQQDEVRPSCPSPQPVAIMQDDFYAASSIPEFPTAASGILVLCACGLMYWWFRRRRQLRPT